MVFAAERSVDIPNKDILSWIFDSLSYDEDKPIYIDGANPSKSISARQARAIIRKVVAGLHAGGVSPGDCVCITSFNDIMYPMLVLGIIAAQAIFTGTNPSYTPFELSHHLKTSHSKFIIAEPELLPTVLVAAKDSLIPQSNIWIFDAHGQTVPAGFRSWKELINHGEEGWVPFNNEKVSKDTIAARLFSSGTTGLPKAVEISHYNLIAEHTLVHEINDADRASEPIRILCLPMFHASTVPISHTSALKSGYSHYIMRRFELEPFLQIIEKYNVNEVLLVPPIMTPLTKKYSMKSITGVLVGAAPLGVDPMTRLRKLLMPNATFTQVYGMTETSCVALRFYHPEDDLTGSIGRPVPNIDVKIIDDEGKDISAYDTVGEMCVRGPIVTSGYFENPKANVESFDSDGFYKTGDIAYCDSKTKKWYMVDRKKELIKVRGFQVAPPEIETVLLSHPHIVDAAVIGIVYPDEPDVEHPRAYVVKRPGPESHSLDEKAVKEFCGQKLARYKSLTGGVIFVDAIPKNASGKILKRSLRESAKAELEKGKARL